MLVPPLLVPPLFRFQALIPTVSAPLVMPSIFTQILSLAHLFYSWSKQKRIRTVRQYSGSLANPRGMYFNGKEGIKEGRKERLPHRVCYLLDCPRKFRLRPLWWLQKISGFYSCRPQHCPVDASSIVFFAAPEP